MGFLRQCIFMLPCKCYFVSNGTTCRYAKRYFPKWHRLCSSVAERLPKNIVYISRSENIHENLALEDWLYEHGDLENNNYLLMWRNAPAVVIGRHQNVWLECDVSQITAQNIQIARRRSGGGTVYHDKGNLNISFIKSRSRYNRKENLELVVQALKSKWDVDLAVNKRDDVILEGLYKVSGTASRLGRTATYHHFTLLLDVDLNRLNSLLFSPLGGAKSRSTESVPANVRNLVEVAPSLDFSSAVECISQEFLQNSVLKNDNQICYVNSVTEKEFPGVSKTVEELKSWNWIYAKTPPFYIIKSYSAQFSRNKLQLDVNIEISKGKISNIKLAMSGTSVLENAAFSDSLSGIEGVNFDKGELSPILNSLFMKCDDIFEEEDLAVAMWVLKCIKSCLLIND